jgi:hypothetical protein
MAFDPRLPFEWWTAVGARLGVHANANAWWLGDWLAYGRMKYGRRYKEAIAGTGLGYQTLRNYAMVARRYEPSRRRADVSFQHHAELVALPDDVQDRWLAAAAESGWSKAELRRRVRASLGPVGLRGVTTVTVRVPVEASREQRWREAAAHSRSDLGAWIVRALDDAADAMLVPAQAPRPRAVEVRRLPGA